MEGPQVQFAPRMAMMTGYLFVSPSQLTAKRARLTKSAGRTGSRNSKQASWHCFSRNTLPGEKRATSTNLLNVNPWMKSRLRLVGRAEVLRAGEIAVPKFVQSYLPLLQSHQ